MQVCEWLGVQKDDRRNPRAGHKSRELLMIACLAKRRATTCGGGWICSRTSRNTLSSVIDDELRAAKVSRERSLPAAGL